MSPDWFVYTSDLSLAWFVYKSYVPWLICVFKLRYLSPDLFVYMSYVPWMVCVHVYKLFVPWMVCIHELCPSLVCVYELCPLPGLCTRVMSPDWFVYISYVPWMVGVFLSKTQKLFIFHYRYFISFMLDSTIGLFVVYLGLKFTQIIVRRYNYASLKFGEYGKSSIYKGTE